MTGKNGMPNFVICPLARGRQNMPPLPAAPQRPLAPHRRIFDFSTSHDQRRAPAPQKESATEQQLKTQHAFPLIVDYGLH
ncbi:MAG: hypothetical protein U1F34_01970 [Gammaproteobacteria bacterium]